MQTNATNLCISLLVRVAVVGCQRLWLGLENCLLICNKNAVSFASLVIISLILNNNCTFTKLMTPFGVLIVWSKQEARQHSIGV